MADFKKYLKEKLKDKKGIVGRAIFLPPDPVNVLQSSASLSVSLQKFLSSYIDKTR